MEQRNYQGQSPKNNKIHLDYTPFKNCLAARTMSMNRRVGSYLVNRMNRKKGLRRCNGHVMLGQLCRHIEFGPSSGGLWAVRLIAGHLRWLPARLIDCCSCWRLTLVQSDVMVKGRGSYRRIGALLSSDHAPWGMLHTNAALSSKSWLVFGPQVVSHFPSVLGLPKTSVRGSNMAPVAHRESHTSRQQEKRMGS
jgi:hypothetical protein